MDIKQAQQDILKWITDFVEIPREELGGWPPCPYARQARLKNLIDIRAGAADPYADARAITTMDSFDVIAVVYDPQEYAAAEFNALVDDANAAFLQGRGIIALADHPGDPEEVCGIVMNQGQYALMFVQDLAKLDGHAQQLAQRGFYDLWPEEYLAVLFRGRRDPRA
jgi:hypothetical protein